MPYQDREQRVCGFLDLEEKEKSGHFVRRYFILDPVSKILQYFLDNPQNLSQGCRNPVGHFNMQFVSMVIDASKLKPKLAFSFALTIAGKNIFFRANDAEDRDGWISVLKDACKIVVPRTECSPPLVSTTVSTADSSSSYQAEVIGGVVVKTPIERQGSIDSDIDSSCDELERDVTTRGPYSHSEPMKTGYCTKQGAVRKNWKRRFFVLDVDGVSYFKSCEEKAPIRSISKAEIIEARVSIGIHLNREFIFEIVTPNRVFYIQTETGAERDSWISAINRCILQHKNKPQSQEVQSQTEPIERSFSVGSRLPTPAPPSSAAQNMPVFMPSKEEDC